MSQPFDLFILGGGSAAFAAAIAASDLGARVAMAESRTIGGTCANRGCLPSKNLIEAARLTREAGHPRYPGLTATAMAIDFAALVGQKDEVVHAYRAKKYVAVAEGLRDFEFISGSACFVDPHTVTVDGRTVEADRFLIATGSRPSIPDLPGLASVPHLTSDLLDADEPGRLTDLPSSLVVLGGGYVAVELAQLFGRLGSRVTLVQRSAQLLRGYEPEIGRLLEQAFRAEGIEVLTEAAVERVDGDDSGVTVTAVVGGERRAIEAARILVATGRRPNTDTLAAAAGGIALDEQGFVVVDAELRTTQPHIWAAGDVIGRAHDSQMATPLGARQGKIVAENAFVDARRKVDHRVIPRAIFTDPEVATVGLTEAEAARRGFLTASVTTPFEHVPRAAAIHRPEGFVKFVVSKATHEVLGVHVVGTSASEIVHEAAMALRFRAKLDDFVDLIHVYPTMSEALKIGALAFTRDVSKLSCCAE